MPPGINHPSCLIQLQLLEKEKEETLATLKKREEETKKLADQNMSLNDATSSLKEDLDKIEKRRKDLEMDLTNIQIWFANLLNT